MVDYAPRANYSAMVAQTDILVQNIVDELKTQEMWDNTLMVVFSDNGGPIYTNGPPGDFNVQSGGANNFPLRGGKFSNTEGGIRVNAFASGYSNH